MRQHRCGPVARPVMPTRPQRIAAPHALALPHVQPRLVQIAGDQPLAVVDQGQAALEMHVGADEGDAAVGGGADHTALGRRQVDAVVGAGGGAVQDALGAPGAGDAVAVQRPDEAVLEVVGVDPAGEALGLQGDLALDAGQERRVARLDGRGRQAVHAGRGKGVGRDVQRAPGRAGAVGRPDLDPCAGAGVAVEADHEQAGGRGGGQGLAVHENQGARRGAAQRIASLTPGPVQRQRQGVAILRAQRPGDQPGAGSRQNGAARGDHFAAD